MRMLVQKCVVLLGFFIVALNCVNAIIVCIKKDRCGTRGPKGQSYRYVLPPVEKATFSFPIDACYGRQIIGFSTSICWDKPSLIMPRCESPYSLIVEKDKLLRGLVELTAYCEEDTERLNDYSSDEVENPENPPENQDSQELSRTKSDTNDK